MKQHDPKRQALKWQERDREVSRRAEEEAKEKQRQARKSIESAFREFGHAARLAAAELVKTGLSMENASLTHSLKQEKALVNDSKIIIGVLAREIHSLTGEWPVVNEEVIYAQDPQKTDILVFPAHDPDRSARTWTVTHRDGTPHPPSIFPDWGSEAE